jgi:hypothetical protein
MDWRTFFVTAILLGAVDVVLFWLGFAERTDWLRYLLWAVNLPAMPIAVAIASSVRQENETVVSYVLAAFAILCWAALLGWWAARRRRRRALPATEAGDDATQYS